MRAGCGFDAPTLPAHNRHEYSGSNGNGMLPSQRALFDIPREVCYLNAASWSPLPIAVQEAGRAGVARKGRPWTIDPGFAAQQHERARRAAARLINADPDDVALISSVSYGVATAAKVLTVPAGARVLLLENDHSSAVLEWMTRAAAQRLHRRRRRGSPMTEIGPRRCSPRSSGPARRRSPSRRSRRCTGPMAGWWTWTASPRRCARMGRRCWSMRRTPSASSRSTCARSIPISWSSRPTSGCWGRMGAPFSTSRSATRKACRWSRRATAGARSPRIARPIFATPVSCPTGDASTWASAIISSRWRWPRSGWRCWRRGAPPPSRRGSACSPRGSPMGWAIPACCSGRGRAGAAHPQPAISERHAGGAGRAAGGGARLCGAAHRTNAHQPARLQRRGGRRPLRRGLPPIGVKVRGLRIIPQLGRRARI